MLCRAEQPPCRVVPVHAGIKFVLGGVKLGPDQWRRSVRAGAAELRAVTVAAEIAAEMRVALGGRERLELRGAITAQLRAVTVLAGGVELRAATGRGARGHGPRRAARG